MFVVRLNGDPGIVLQSHAFFQETDLITWFSHDLVATSQRCCRHVPSF
jgi:hypothetical protein